MINITVYASPARVAGRRWKAYIHERSECVLCSTFRRASLFLYLMKHAFQHVLTKLTSINNNLDVKIMGILLNFKFACFKKHQNLGRWVSSLRFRDNDCGRFNTYKCKLGDDLTIDYLNSILSKGSLSRYVWNCHPINHRVLRLPHRRGLALSMACLSMCS